MIYPWQQSIYQQLWSSRQSQRLSHALIFTGPLGVGKYALAMHFIQSLLCKQVGENGYPCDDCHGCRMLLNQSHPDFIEVKPEQTGHAIKVDQIRSVSEFVNQSSIQGHFRIILIHPAHSMNANAANALLKTLEEPAPGAVILMLTDQYGRLPATIRSRCQRYLFAKPEFNQALTWLNESAAKEVDFKQLLKMTSGSPLLALNILNKDSSYLSERNVLLKGLLSLVTTKPHSIVKLAAELQDSDLIATLSCFITWLMDIIRLQLVETANVINDDYKQQLQELTVRSTPKNYLQLINYIQRVQQQISTGINFNKTLLLEGILLRWQRCIVCT